MSGHQKILNTKILTSLLALLTAGLLSACGGAAGDAAPSITYSGLTTQATLTADNDDKFGLAMLEGGAESGKALNQIKNAAPTDNTASQSTAKNQLSAMETMVQEIIAKTLQQLNQGQESTGANASLQVLALTDGTCGGNYDMSYSQGSSGNITFNNYCTSVTVNGLELKTTMNGTVSISLTGDYDSGTYDVILSYSAMTVTIEYDTDTTTHHFSGTITISAVNGSYTYTYSTSFQREGKIYKLENPSISGSTTSIYVSGKLYHPDYGYVTITTTSPFSKLGSQYCGGTLLIETKKDDGTTISSSTMTIASDCKTYTINYNTEGDSAPIQWP